MTLFHLLVQYTMLFGILWVMVFGFLYMMNPAWARQFTQWTKKQLISLLRWGGSSLGQFIQRNPIPFGVVLLILLIVLFSAIKIN